MSRDDGRRIPPDYRPPRRKTRRHLVRIPRSGRLSERHHRGLSAEFPLVPRRRGSRAVPRNDLRHSGLHQQRRRPVRLWRGAGRRPARGERPAGQGRQREALPQSAGLHLRNGLRRGHGRGRRTEPRRQLVRGDLLPAPQEDARRHRRGGGGRACREARLRRALG